MLAQCLNVLTGLLDVKVHCRPSIIKQRALSYGHNTAAAFTKLLTMHSEGLSLIIFCRVVRLGVALRRVY